jgi:hypothetical protein
VCGLSLTRVLYKSARDGHENVRVSSVSIVNVAMGARVMVNSLGGSKSSGPQQILAARCNDNRAALPALFRLLSSPLACCRYRCHPSFTYLVSRAYCCCFYLDDT